jgi:dUTP pyrophosphatase
MQVLFKKESPTAILPKKGSERAAGFDLYADLGFGNVALIYPNCRLLVATNIAVALPENTEMRIAPRSGTALKNGIMVLGGVIDEDYRGSIGVILFNSDVAPFKISHGDRIAQGVISLLAPITEVFEVDALPDSARGVNGFGSTGV